MPLSSEFLRLSVNLTEKEIYVTFFSKLLAMVVAVSDMLFRYGKMAVTPGTPAKVVSTPHAQRGLGLWKSKAERIEDYYSKRCGVLTGDVDVLLHVRPLKGWLVPCLFCLGICFLTSYF